MKAVYLVKKGKADEAFEIRETQIPILDGPGEVLIKVEGFGLNYADIMARRGLYRDAPPMPSVLGYDVVGSVEKVSSKEDEHLIGKRVVALTRFGGYAEYAKTFSLAVTEIPESLDVAQATAIATQYCTAFFAGQYLTNLFPGEKVLIHAAAGGVGTALTQLAKYHGCEVYGLTSSDTKFNYLKDNGVDYPINYTKESYHETFKKLSGGFGADVIFNSVGGSSFRKDFKLLNSGGRLVSYGTAEISGKSSNMFTILGLIRKFGIYSPIQFLANTKTVVGVNMLNLADNNKKALKYSMDSVVKLIEQENNIMPKGGGVYSVNEIGKAHEHMESRKSTGKIAVVWN